MFSAINTVGVVILFVHINYNFFHIFVKRPYFFIINHTEQGQILFTCL